MTTMELIEKGIGHNCLSDAYDLGRAEAERDFQNSDYWNDYLAQVIKDAKADAIEEFVSNFEKEFAPNLDGSLIAMIEFSKWFDKVNKIAEQLEENL